MESLAAAAKSGDILDAAWPVSELDFQAFGRAAYRAFAEAAASLDGPAQDLFLADVRMVDELIQVAHARAVIAASAGRGMALRMGPQSQTYYEPDWTASALLHEKALSSGTGSLGRLRQLRRFVAGNGHLFPAQRVRALIKGPRAWVAGWPDPLLREWARRRRVSLAWPDFNRLQTAPVPSAWQGPAEAARECTLSISRAAKEHIGGDLPVDEAFGAWHSRIGTLSRVAAGASQKAPPDAVIVAGAGNPLYRILALAARRRGAQVVCAQHGHNAGHLDADIICFNDYAIADVYVCESPAAREVAERRAGFAVVPPGRRIDFLCLPEPTNAVRWQARKPATRRTARTVMLMGFPHSARRSCSDIGYHFYARVDLERRLARQFHADGYQVLYKAHPETAAMTAPILEHEVDEFLRDRFESVAGRADIFLFTYPLTTTLGEALLTETPIAMLDIEGQKWSPHEREPLERRMAMIPARVEDGARIVFEPDDVRAGLALAQSLRSHEYSHRFLLSTPHRSNEGSL